MPLDARHHRRRLRQLSAASSLLYALVLAFANRLPLFDASPALARGAETPLIRWDALYFVHIAEAGYVYEQEWAFLPAAPLLIRISSNILDRLTHSSNISHLILAAATALLASETVQTLYSLSLHHLKSPHLAFLASILALLPTSPATLLFVPYNEPFFTFLSYKGMLACARQQWILASVFFALAGIFRSNGVLLSGFILWGLAIHPFLLGQKIRFTNLLKSVFLTSIVILPFIAYQATAYVAFCSDSDAPAEWCSRFPPSIYSHVQSKYWNVGFLRYWTLSQFPNFLIAAPSFAVIFAFVIHHFQALLSESRKKAGKDHPSELLQTLSVTPHAIHALVFSFILLFASHTQIVTRLAASIPFTYWSAAWLYSEHPTYGAMWVTWSVLWGLISTILWAAFLPPA